MLSFAVTVYNFNSGLVFVILCTPYALLSTVIRPTAFWWSC